MALTDFCSIFASVHENAINTVVKAVATQRPSLFNYGTPFFVQHRNLMCEKIVVHPKLPPSQPRVGAQLPVPGTNGPFRARVLHAGDEARDRLPQGRH